MANTRGGGGKVSEIRGCSAGNEESEGVEGTNLPRGPHSGSWCGCVITG